MSRHRHRDVDWSPYASKYEPIKVGSIDGTDVEPHDRAIVRATSASYKPDPHLASKPESTLFVARLHQDVTEKDLDKLFSRYGKLKSVNLVRDLATGFSKRYGFVEFKDSRDCRKAQREANKLPFMGKEILVDYECQRTLPRWVPRRLGGGFGGRKESGQLRFGCIDKPWKMPIALQYAERHRDHHYHEQKSRLHDRDRNDELERKRKRSDI